MPTDRLTLDDRLGFERVALALAALGVTTGGLAAVGGGRWMDAPIVVFGPVAVGLLAASTLRNRDDGLRLPARLGLLVATVVVVQSMFGLEATVLSLGALAGLALAGTRRLAGLVAGAVGAAWALAVVPRLASVWAGWPVGPRGLALGAAAGVLFAVPLLAAHVRVHADALAARLTDERLKKLWARCHAALAPAPAAERKELLGLLARNVAAAERDGLAVQVFEARLKAAGRAEAEAQLAQLKADAEGTTDPTARQRLAGAAASLGDSLEALDGLERKRERLEADVRLSVATLERAAISLETAQGAPDELRAVALRLLEPRGALDLQRP